MPAERSAPPAAPRDDGPRSLWAVASLACSVAACPPLCIIGPLLGGVALLQIGRRPQLRGRRLAMAGIAIGCWWIAVWIGAGLWWNAHARRPMLEGPRVALRQGFDGDLDGFRAAFCADGATASDAEVSAFIDALRSRYGAFRSSRQDPDRTASAADRRRPLIAYTLHFARATVDASAVFVVSDDQGLVLRFHSLVVHDPRLGDLAYPVAVPGGDDGAAAR